MISQPEQMNGRVVMALNTPPTQGLNGGGGGGAQGFTSTEPMITLSPRTSTGLRTRGFMFCLLGMLEGAPTTTIKIWKRATSVGWWQPLATVTDWAGEWVTVCDVNACQLWFELPIGPASLGLAIEELGISP